jgi:hypothetical protein
MDISVCLRALWLQCWRNARRDAAQAADFETSERAEIEAFSDMTEKEKPAFRYVY